MTRVVSASLCDASKVVPRRNYGPGKRERGPAPSHRTPRVPRKTTWSDEGRSIASRDSLTKLRTIGDAAERARTNAERSVSRGAKRLALEADVRAREAAERFAAGATEAAVDSFLPACFTEEVLLFDGWKKGIDEFWRESAGEWSTVGSERDVELARIKRIFEERETSDSDTEEKPARQQGVQRGSAGTRRNEIDDDEKKREGSVRGPVPPA